MHLLQDVELIGAGIPGLADRVEISDGTQCVTEFRGEKFCPDSYIPRLQWRTPVAEELTLLCPHRPRKEAGSWVSLLRLPAFVLSPFAPLRQQSRSLTGVADVRGLARTFETDTNLAPVLAYCSGLLTNGQYLLESTGIRTNPPGLVTVTDMPRGGCFVGLHLDSWYRAPLEERHLSPNRICINLGCNDRYLIYINLQLKNMVKMVNEPVQSEAIGADFPPQFLRKFPSYPVVRIRVRPGEAYIAPTENIAHDGSSIDSDAFDIQLTVRGNFAPVG